MNPDDADNPISGLLGDLLKVIGGGARGAGSPWLDAARALAYGVATDDGTESNPDPLQRIKLEELARVVELHVEGATGLSMSEGRAYSFVPVGRGAWANRALDGWRPLLEQMVDSMADLPAPPAQPGGEEVPDGLQALLGQFASTMGPIMLGMQFGSAAGHLARHALGQYALVVPWPKSNELLVVPENVATFATDWSLPEDATLLWVCAHELTVQLVLDRPHIASRLTELLEGAVAESMAAQQGIAERLSGAGGPESLQQLMSDPEALLADLLTPGTRATSDRLNALVAALTGYVDHATAKIAEAITGSSGSLSEAWYRYRVADIRGRQAAAALFGFDVGRAEVDRGAGFVRGVLERGGEEGLARLVSDEKALPTPAEVEAPGLWLERIDLPDEPAPDGAGSAEN
ncbi:MAG: zinc-dependent metalloprotease [Acidimicrobiales bacterium]